MHDVTLSKAKILVADDEEAQRAFLGDLLEDQGFRVIPARDGDEALQLLLTQPVDLALLDILMPRRSGFAVCRTIKSRPETRLLPVVLVTGLADSEDRIQGIECGADDFLNKPVNKEELLARVRPLLKLKRFVDELERAETVVFTLARSIEAKDPHTEGHSERLARYAVALARHLGLSEEQMVALERGGIVHDVGKVSIPDHILLKPGPLTPEERKIVELHPVIGERICALLQSFRLVLPIIRHHHERLDGSGYPEGLKDDKIPLTARILTVVDVYDALTTDRPYRKALSREEAFTQMWEELNRGWWGKTLLSEFEQLFGK